MVLRYFVLSCLLLQGLVAVASENSQVSLNKSNGALRRSEGSLSKSQEIPQVRRPSGGVSVSYESPCSNRLYNPKKEMIPMDPWRSDCP
jgi:hypothetical protein